MGKVEGIAAILAVLAAVPAHGAWLGTLTHIPHRGAIARKSLVQPVLLRSEIDTSLSKMTESGQFKVSVSPRPQPVPINRMHQWILSVAGPDGHPIDDVKVEISGDALGRNRQLPTAPRVTRYLGGGQYLIEGVRFNMAGWWELKLRVESGQHRDSVTFNIEIK